MSNDTPKLAAPLRETMANAFNAPVKIDAEIYHMMDKRDEALIADEVLHGVTSKIFVYDFEISGTKVSGVSIKGARHLANYYGGLKHRIVSSTEKRGALFTFKSYPAENIPMQVNCSVIQELEKDDDFYEVVIEITDIKTGNSVQVSKSEKRFEKKRDGGTFERPNYRTIAESKARRNAILDLTPQDVQERFKEMCRKEGTAMTISPIDEKRDAVMKFAAAKAISFTREQVHGLDWNQISGLSEAAKEGVEAFRQSATALGLMTPALTDGTPPPAKPKATAKPKPAANAAHTIDPNTGEITDTPKPAAANNAPPAGHPVAEAEPAAPKFIEKEVKAAEQKAASATPAPAAAAKGGFEFND